MSDRFTSEITEWNINNIKDFLRFVKENHRGIYENLLNEYAEMLGGN